MAGLATFYRPKSFKTFIGNDDVKKSLSAVLKRDNPPAAFLFTGGSGTGKTSMGRVIKRALKCSDADFKELNAADDRGIDGVRGLIQSMKFAPLSGTKKVILLDECFSACTSIPTSEGQKRIDLIKVNDAVFNLNGTDIVEKVFINKVPLSRVIKINKSDGSSTFCSEDQEYYLDGNWIKAKDLTNILLVRYSEPMINTSSLCEVQNDLQKDMSILRKGIFSEEQKQKVLFKQLFSILQRIIKRKKCFRFKKLFMVQKDIYHRSKDTKILLKKLFREICKKLCKENWTIKRDKGKNKQKVFRFLSNKRRQGICTKIIRTYEGKQSDESFWCEREGNRNKKSKWNSSCLERKAWWEWSVDRTTEIINGCISLAIRSCSENSRSFAYETTGSLVPQKKNSNFLQSGFGKSKIKDCNRNRRKGTQLYSETKTGQKERVSSSMERVESVEIYKRGSNDESFSSIIGHKERDQGFVEFYDLQVKENHSYIANGNMVHNCHSITKIAQESLLKALEEPPAYVHWILCTTNPEALKSTLKRRCHTYELEFLKSSDLQKLFRMILKKEKRECISMDVRDHIIELADGSAGQALKLLDQVIDMDDSERAINTLKSAGTSETEVIEICRTLSHYNMPPKTKWAKIKKILKDFKGDGESARRPILMYMNSIMLNNGDDNIFFMMENFENNFFDSGKAGLTLACYKSVFGGE